MNLLSKNCLALLLFSATTALAWAGEKEAGLAHVASPDGRLVVSLHEGRFGSLTWALRFGDETLVEEAQLGMRFAEQAGFDRDLVLLGSETASASATSFRSRTVSNRCRSSRN